MNSKTQTYTSAKLTIAFALFTLITVTPFGTWLESSMVAHVLIELPLLVAIGVIIGHVIQPYKNSIFDSINAGGIAGILLTTFTLAFWMIPKWLDSSLTEESVAWAKYLSLPILAGIPLAISWKRLHTIARGVVKIEFLSMLFRLGWLYIISPSRLCNNYLLDEQQLLGKGLIIIGLSLSITWLIPVFFGKRIYQAEA